MNNIEDITGNKASSKVLVAGGAGFIGSHLCDRLLLEGYEVVCVDNLYTGSMANIRHLLHNPKFRFIRHDITSPLSIEGLSFVFNLACPASPVHYQKDAVYTTKTAVLGTLNMLELARTNGCPIMQSSTSEVYGDPLVHQQTEDYYGNVNPVGVRSCYDEGKRCAESLCMDYHRQYCVSVKIVRIFNTYGPRMAVDDGRVVSNFIPQALLDKPITVYGDGTQTRSFQYVDDLIEGIIRMAVTPADFTGPVNIGNPEEHTIMDLAHLIIELTNTNSTVVQSRLPSDDPHLRCPNISLAYRELGGWQPKVDLTEGLVKTIQYFRSK